MSLNPKILFFDEPSAGLSPKAAAEVLDMARGLTRDQVINDVLLAKQPGRYIGWPTVARTRGGELIVAFSGDREAHVCPFGKTQIVRSRDNGKTWSEPYETPLWGFPPHLLQLSDGRILCSYGYRRAPYGQRVCISDDGITWTSLVKGEPVLESEYRKIVASVVEVDSQLYLYFTEWDYMHGIARGIGIVTGTITWN